LFSGKTISSRGRVFIDTAGLFAINLLGCSEFLEDVKKLQPDTESCKGVVAAPVPIPKGSELNTDSDNALAEVESVDNTENQLVGSDDAATDVG